MSTHSAQSMQDQVALVTGASRGIGRAIAVRLAEQGCDVVVNYRADEAAARATAALIEQQGRAAFVIQADVAEAEQAGRMADSALERFGRIDILVNNAGITCNDLLLRMPAEDIEAVVRTNLFGVIYPTQAIALPMIRQRSGRIVNLSSSAATKPGPGQDGPGGGYSARRNTLRNVGLYGSLPRMSRDSKNGGQAQAASSMSSSMSMSAKPAAAGSMQMAAPAGGGSAKCKDGTTVTYKHRQGTCSGHGGVASWM